MSSSNQYLFVFADSGLSDQSGLRRSVVLYSLFRRSTKWCLENLRSVQFFCPLPPGSQISGLKKNSLISSPDCNFCHPFSALARW
jgi:hypothetical protein